MKIYNTITRRKEELRPIHDDEVLMYVCGPTVYNYFHIGNARPFVVFDTLRRYLEYRGRKVNFVQNFTDVDDKILARAAEEGVSSREIGDKYIAAYFEDARALGVRKATHHPRVTENMDAIIDFVKALVDKGHAYVVDGNVYFDTESWPRYGALSGQDVGELRAGARIDVDERKQSPLDFALWKAAKEGEDLSWDSPWGKGRPGWHIECSAMSKRYLGDTIDIHAGGQDLIFPHHENEIAQSEAANGVTFSNAWMHNGYITIDKEKMAKSKGNFFTVRDILKDYDGETVRFFLLAGHYRGPIDFSKDLMEQSKAALGRMRTARDTLSHIAAKSDTEALTDAERASLDALLKYKDKFIAAMDDDLNTADAIAAIFELIADVNTQIAAAGGASKAYAQGALALLLELANVLGLLETPAAGGGEEGEDPEVLALIEARGKARAEKDWARADEIRDRLKAKGIVLKDTPQGVQIIREGR
ncbi:MAG: cysteine--tRNA ligase [Clostridiales Family XIII bacterium]|jgi:cysteinyl-tRNA synthetase|nr:cysteine--tRNA ligase [Clostridiales Family XIII bacterium]